MCLSYQTVSSTWAGVESGFVHHCIPSIQHSTWHISGSSSGINGWVDGLVDGTIWISTATWDTPDLWSLHRHLPQLWTKYGDRKALLVALGVAATSGRGLSKQGNSQGTGSALEVQRYSLWFLYHPSTWGLDVLSDKMLASSPAPLLRTIFPSIQTKMYL